MTQPTLKRYNWLNQEAKHSTSQQSKVNETVTPLYGLDPKGVRDWNEEYQIVKDFPSDTVT